jgi:hypothetical protein
VTPIGRPWSGVERRELIVTAAITLLLSNCSVLPKPRPVSPDSTREWSVTMQLHGKPLQLHLAAPPARGNDPVLVLYASGDGGWLGAAVDMFHLIAKAGYPTIGFSSRAFLKLERPHGLLTSPVQLAEDYEQILQRARVELGLDPGSDALMAGWSRGAAFAVLAASEPAAPHHVVGVVAIGLDDGEDLAIGGKPDDTDDGPASTGDSRHAFETYARIDRLAPLPCAVIQASRDNYLPAARARQLFGPDTPLRRLYTIEARNHRFSGGKVAFNAALLDAIHWVVSAPSRHDRRGIP